MSAKHKIMLVSGISFFAFSGFLLAYATYRAFGMAELLVSVLIFIASLLTVIFVVFKVEKESVRVEDVSIRPIAETQVKPGDVIRTIIRLEFFWIIAMVYLVPGLLFSWITERYVNSLIFPAVYVAFLGGSTGRLSQKTVLAEEGIVIDGKLTRWDRIHGYRIADHLVVLYGRFREPIAVIPDIPSVVGFLAKLRNNQNV
ncbi:hypothetical protein GACE_1966 [Geoglobus acetivorans]|uniref:DUF5673 domain-containing protein n=2 Tax=Geoglobus acetivorans TaxID=565033 RepID=A0A0A7GJ94_GEOAI|nr:hypothetical protein GACE_1966 [Geoglobus acetivorans]